ncbi:DUF1697 domain-containing protein [Wenyingzhuangia aestuarii]|uniref:DUF1697 domain-containing protein n=1 Tax=Wenyingzhuangia aestuarii TaxID=1647582 RepID=UPI00143A1701|nr:DUF1697 domain-containing protein [Wenyingzhuangia aestuarii]NJB82346.1 uncharacterized protein (DUF1697 family) [Wenyingzhuangia aestuarii]
MIYIVLLRGINVSGKNKMIMKDFVSLLANVDEFTKVNSYIQSGNFVIKSNLNTVKDISLIINNVITNHYGYNIEVFTYTLTHFKELVNKHPFEIIDKRNYVVFTKNGSQNPKGLDQKNFGSDNYRVDSLIIHICYATKYSDSKLNNNSIEKLLQTTATSRNWNTVQKLIAMASA